MLKQVLILTLAVASVSANFGHTDCGSQSEVLEFTFRNCDRVPCTLQRGHDYYGQMRVISAAHSPTLNYTIHAVFGFPIPAIPLFDGDTCRDLTTGYFPVTVGEHLVADLSMSIPTNIPAMNADVRITVRDGANRIQICLQMAVNLV